MKNTKKKHTTKGSMFSLSSVSFIMYGRAGQSSSCLDTPHVPSTTPRLTTGRLLCAVCRAPSKSRAISLILPMGRRSEPEMREVSTKGIASSVKYLQSLLEYFLPFPTLASNPNGVAKCEIILQILRNSINLI